MPTLNSCRFIRSSWEAKTSFTFKLCQQRFEYIIRIQNSCASARTLQQRWVKEHKESRAEVQRSWSIFVDQWNAEITQKQLRQASTCVQHNAYANLPAYTKCMRCREDKETRRAIRACDHFKHKRKARVNTTVVLTKPNRMMSDKSGWRIYSEEPSVTDRLPDKESIASALFIQRNHVHSDCPEWSCMLERILTSILLHRDRLPEWRNNQPELSQVRTQYKSGLVEPVGFVLWRKT